MQRRSAFRPNVLLLAVLGACQTSGAMLVPEGGDLDFGEVLIGDSRFRDYPVRAEGGTVVIETFKVAGSGARSFSASSRRGSTLADGEKDTTMVTFRPRAEGTVSAELNVELRQGADGLFPKQLQGKGVTWISRGGLAFEVPEADAALDFGVVPKGQDRDMRLKVKNNSPRKLTYRVVVMDPIPVFFNVGIDEDTIEAGETRTLILRFRPKDDGATYVRAVVFGSLSGGASAGAFAGVTLLGREGRPQIPKEGFSGDG